MALTITPSALHPVDDWGALPIRFVTAKPAAADYATGGYTITPGQGIPLGSIFTVIPVGGQGGFEVQWNTATGKLQVFGNTATPAANAPLTEVAAGTDLSALTLTLLVIGLNP
jgi:hypothetical protein